MGCFNVACNLSGLPIYHHDKVLAVVCIPNTATYRSDVSMCYSTDIKYPCLFPVRGEYDDYGGIEKVKEDGGTIVSCEFLDEKINRNEIKYTESYSSHNYDDAAGMELWVKLITRCDVQVSRHPMHSGEEFVGTNLSVAFVLEKAYQGYLQVYDPRERLRADLDNWLTWYVAVTKKLLAWVAEKPKSADRRHKAHILSRWGYQASYFANGDVSDKSYLPIKLPKINGDGKHGLNPLFGFVGEGSRYVDGWWFLHAYGEFIETLVRSDKQPLKDVTDPRWTALRDAFVEFIPLCYLMDRLHRTWLPTVTAGQDRDYEFDLAIGKVNTEITAARLKKWKRENGE